MTATPREAAVASRAPGLAVHVVSRARAWRRTSWSSGVGVRPRVALAAAAELKLDLGVLVDERLEARRSAST